MRLQSIIGGIAGAALVVVAVSAQVDLKKVARLVPAAMTETAPATFKANLDTTKGMIVIEVHRDWAPLGADRFYNLVKNGFYDEVRFFRVIPNFMAQFGMNGTPAIQKNWSNATMKDDPVKQGNKRGFVSYGKTGAPNSRTTQLFINFRDNTNLDPQGFAAFGEVVSGMNFVDQIFSGYGDEPDQSLITAQGNAYLMKQFPKLDYIKTATIAAK